jgi:hypothetical protein
MPPPAPWWAKARDRGVPWWGAVCSAAAPVLLGAGSTIGGHLQPRPYNAMTGTVSALAAIRHQPREAFRHHPDHGHGLLGSVGG